MKPSHKSAGGSQKNPSGKPSPASGKASSSTSKPAAPASSGKKAAAISAAPASKSKAQSSSSKRQREEDELAARLNVPTHAFEDLSEDEDSVGSGNSDKYDDEYMLGGGSDEDEEEDELAQATLDGEAPAASRGKAGPVAKPSGKSSSTSAAASTATASSSKSSKAAAAAAPAPGAAKGKAASAASGSALVAPAAVTVKPTSKRALFESDSEGEDDEDEDEEQAAGGYDDEDDDDEEAEGDEDDEDEDGDSDEDEDEDEDDASGLDDDDYRGGDFEAAARKQEAKRVRIAAEADAEQRLQISEQERFELPTAAELEEERQQPRNLGSIKRRVQDLVYVLTDFRSRRDPLRPRAEYVECLAQDMSDYFGYNRDLIDLFLDLFTPMEAHAFLEANDTPRPVTIRVNTLKTKRRELVQALMARGVALEPLGKWTGVGLKVTESPVALGATPEYLAGHYMLQSAASMAPVIALDPQPGERVLDMAAAPGGKTTHIAQLMGNTGVLLANDPKPNRLPSLQANLARLGVSNAVVCSMDGRKIPASTRGFDRVLLDAPCTGLGVIARDPSARTTKSRADVQKMCTLQKQLLLAAIDAVDASSATGGYIVYSTCSVAVQENEAVVNYVLRKRHVKLVPFTMDNGEDMGRPGLTSYASGNFHPDLKHTRRFFPHVHNMDGFYVAKLKKLSNEIPVEKPGQKDEVDEAEEEYQHAAASSSAAASGKGKTKPAHGGAGKAARAVRSDAMEDAEYDEDGDEDGDMDSGSAGSGGGAGAGARKSKPVRKEQNPSKAERAGASGGAGGKTAGKPSAAAADGGKLAGKKRPREDSAPPAEHRKGALTASAPPKQITKLMAEVGSGGDVAAAKKQHKKHGKAEKLATFDDDDDDEGAPGSSSAAAGGSGSGVVSFVKEGDRSMSGKKKRKAGKRVREAKDAKAAAQRRAEKSKPRPGGAGGNKAGAR